MTPLAGIKVLELARILAGPWAGQLLSDLGADVTKIESHQGDDTRQWGPPFVESPTGQKTAAYFHCCNRGKRSVVADFNAADGREMVCTLANASDVLIENFKVGSLAKYGLDYASLSKSNPRLIYCSITGFGQTGPYAERPGYDFLIQGMGGLMDITGAGDGPPMKVGVALVDILTGVYATTAIQAALIQRERTGRGQQIDMSLLDVQVAVLANQAQNYLSSGVSPKRLGNDHPNIVPYGVFPVRDGNIIVACGNDGQFRSFAKTLGADDLATSDLYATNELRVVNRNLLMSALNAYTCTFEKAVLVERLQKANVPAGPINSIADVFDDPQVKARQMLVTLPSGGIGVRAPIVFSGATLQTGRPAPELGEHTSDAIDRAERSGTPV